MHIGILSDTHDNVTAVERAIEIFEDAGIDTLIHCGDYIAPPVVTFFQGFELHGVLGNNDGELDSLESAFRDLGHGSELHGRFAELEFDGTRFVVLHGEDLDRIDRLARSGEYDYVLYGHHHEVEQRDVGETTVINPGAHFPTVSEEHRSIVVLDTVTDDVRFIQIE